ncbi:ATP-binding protein [Azospirillum sp. SYSU D00513]|uniref:ATP-binding protein n=1 Tax=Azospirillum sp. SYSU D00513 TaxID=2812561 RepID=UPI001A970AA7|nr:ATP-binding protein [Azospirillum sp. SYSU D00513]
MSDLASVPQILPLLTRIAEALERLAPPPDGPLPLGSADAFVWHADPDRLDPVASVNRVEIGLLQGVEHQREQLLENTRRFAAGLPANNALLWGSRGMGKSSLVKSVHAAVSEAMPGTLALVEIHREDIPTLPRLLARLKGEPRRFILFCDDLSFDHDDAHYKSLKAVLEGGVEGRPENVVFYATSNRRHLMPRDMIENERSTAINPAEAVEEKVSLSDRFGLWLGFHNCDQPTYFAMVEGYARRFGLDVPVEELHAGAVEWQMTRGSRSGRVAWQFIQDLAGRLGKPLR